MALAPRHTAETKAVAVGTGLAAGDTEGLVPVGDPTSVAMWTMTALKGRGSGRWVGVAVSPGVAVLVAVGVAVFVAVAVADGVIEGVIAGVEPPPPDAA